MNWAWLSKSLYISFARSPHTLFGRLPLNNFCMTWVSQKCHLIPAWAHTELTPWTDQVSIFLFHQLSFHCTKFVDVAFLSDFIFPALISDYTPASTFTKPSLECVCFLRYIQLAFESCTRFEPTLHLRQLRQWRLFQTIVCSICSLAKKNFLVF